MTDYEWTSDDLQREIHRLAEAFHLNRIGFVALREVDSTKKAEYETWLSEGRHADMHYLTQHNDIRFSPDLLLGGAQSAIIAAISYYPQALQPSDAPQIAKYAYGRDYHKVVKQVLDKFARAINDEIAPHNYRVIVDTAPFLERYWAEQSGIGFVGKNQNLIIPREGSFFFLGEILTTLPLHAEHKVLRQLCSTCNKCIDACPTQALDPIGGLDARLCVSYLTIEHRGEIDPKLSQYFGNRLYGCDTCQDVCPFNHRPIPTHHFTTHGRHLALTDEHLLNFDEEAYAHFFYGTAATRAKFDGMKRNVDIYLQNNPINRDKEE